MRALFWSVVAVIILYLIWIRIKSIQSKINFNIEVDKTQFKDNTLLQNIAQTLVAWNNTRDVNVRIDVINKNNFSIGLSDLKVYLYYKKALLSETESASKILLVANGTTSINETATVSINSSTLDLITNFKSGNATESVINYIVKVRIYGLPFTFQGTYNLVTGQST